MFQFGGETENRPTHLQYLNVTTISNDECLHRHVGNHQRAGVYKGTLCALSKGRRGACNGDRGSALVSNNQVIGVVSWFVECGRGYPDGYTRISEFLPWIQQVADVFPV